MILVLSLLVSLVFALQELEKGEIEKLFFKLAKNTISPVELKALKAYIEELKIEVEPYLRLYAKALVLEREGKLGDAIELYLRSIELNPDYNPSYYRFNFLIRKVKNKEVYREKIAKILRERFKTPPPVLVKNPREHYVFLVEKMSQYLFVFKGNKLVELYPVTTGKNIGDKEREGDGKTPEGVYYFTRFIPPQQLPEMYGGIAVALNYPNPYDRLLGKTGGGIWLHGSNEEDRDKLPFSTRGCVVAQTKVLKESIVPKIDLTNTLIGIYKTIPKELEIDDVISFLRSWERAWERKDLEGFISFYSENFTWKGGGLKEWRNYKRRTILSKKYIKVKISDLTVLAFAKLGDKKPRYYVAEFFQEYESDTYADKGIKRMYIVREKGRLKILSEEFTIK
ncbi:MAG: L,D-transpeptidase family protein [Aquificae bacterium]|nr:L,D-transpeptidase family protein [Aquificota bacterium]